MGGRGDPPQDGRRQVRLPDINLLVYAADEDARQHEQAVGWVETALSGTETVAFTWHTLLGFLLTPLIATDPCAAR